MIPTAERDRMTGYFLPENDHMRKGLSADEMDAIAKAVLGTDDIRWESYGTGGENAAQYLVWGKEQRLIRICFRCRRIFEFCRVLYEDGRFMTGIDDGDACFHVRARVDKFERYAAWC